MRIYLLSLAIVFLCLYSWKDWYKALCGLVAMMALIERPDIPKSMLGIPGLNFWNILFATVFLAYLAQKTREGLKWDMQDNLTRFLLFYLFVVLLAFLREVFDLGGAIEFETLLRRDPPTIKGVFIDDVINTIKYAIPGILMFMGCRSEHRLKFAIGAVLLMNFLLALQIIRWMPISEVANAEILKDRAVRVLDREIGYYRTDLAIILAGASWAFFAYRAALTSKLLSYAALGAMAVTALGMALTGGRIGMGGWVVVALVLAIFRWRRFLLLAPLLVVMVGVFVPSVIDRMTEGFSGETEEHRPEGLAGDTTSAGGVDLYAVTAGRAQIWPYVIDKIAEGPFIGYGRRAMQRTGLSLWLGYTFEEPFPHPHNAYLQFLLDNGILLSLPVFIFYFLLLKFSLSLFRDSSNNLYIAVGGGTLSIILAQLVGSVGSQSFYPTESSVSMWCMIGLMLRVYLQREKLNKAVAVLKKPVKDKNKFLWKV